MNATDNPPPNIGIVNRASSYGVTETVDRLLALFQSTGMKIFARIDQQLEAQAVGLSMLPTCVLIFGDPRVGTALMNQFPSLALDWLLKVLVWQYISGSVWDSYYSGGYLQQRHSLPETPLKALDGLIGQALARFFAEAAPVRRSQYPVDSKVGLEKSFIIGCGV